MFQDGIELYIGLKGSSKLTKVGTTLDTSNKPCDSKPIQPMPAEISISMDFFKAPYDERVKILKSQTRFYGSKNSIRRSLAHE